MTTVSNNAKDPDGNLSPMIPRSGSHFGEFAESACGIKDATYTPWNLRGKEEEPESYMALETIAKVVYDLDKCSVSMSDVGVESRTSRVIALESLARLPDSFTPALQSLPKQSAEYHMGKLKKSE